MDFRVAGRAHGFSLIELLVALAVVGVLAGLAYPSYTGHVERAHRAQARAALLEAAQYLERYYVANNTYATAVLPVALQTSPPGASGVDIRYRLSVEVTATGYKVIATNATLRGGCDTLSLDHRGVRQATQRGIDGNVSTAEIATACWR